jgi:hypothetical protein
VGFRNAFYFVAFFLFGSLFATDIVTEQTIAWQANLASNLPNVANNVTPRLVNPFGIAFLSGEPFFIADNNAGRATVHDATGLSVRPGSFTVPNAAHALRNIGCQRSFRPNAATTVSDLQIKEWPRNLRTDLKGASVKVVLPENEPDRPWNDALIRKFRELTGIEVQTIRPGNDTSAVLSTYLREFETGSPRADVYAIDIVWPGILSEYAEDLRPAFGGLHDMVPGLVANNTVHGRLVAVPYFVEISLLYYRRDLLEKYHFAQPPRTWNDLEQQGKVIANGERANGKETFWGFLWQRSRISPFFDPPARLLPENISVLLSRA